MNIQEAKKEIVRTLHAYNRQKADGVYQIPPEKQRPVLLMGPPGIGKTAIMEQIALKENIGLVSYTMTHHTRQSAIGLPVIQNRTFEGMEYEVTEYTMSEMIAKVYETMKEKSVTQGILFLDEINCVSETLAPVMLQLLQNKMFGTHKMPEGWLIVAAGNPPEYNHSVRDFDMATLDRVRNIDIEANLEVWQNYAFEKQVHPAIRTYLSVHPDYFYVIEEETNTQSFVTARGWEDLSCILQAYEEAEEEITEELVLQYLQHEEIARSFFLFYDLFKEFLPCRENQLENLLKEHATELDEIQCLLVASLLSQKLQIMSEEGNYHRRILERWEGELGKMEKNPEKERLTHLKEAYKVKKEHRIFRGSDQQEEEDFIRELELFQQGLQKELSKEKRLERLHEKQHQVEQQKTSMVLELQQVVKEDRELLEQTGRENCVLFFAADIARIPFISGTSN